MCVGLFILKFSKAQTFAKIMLLHVKVICLIKEIYNTFMFLFLRGFLYQTSCCWWFYMYIGKLFCLDYKSLLWFICRVENTLLKGCSLRNLFLMSYSPLKVMQKSPLQYFIIPFHYKIEKWSFEVAIFTVMLFFGVFGVT